MQKYQSLPWWVQYSCAAPAPASWTPADLSPNFWYRMDDVLTSGTSITQFNDRGSNSVDATPGGSGTQWTLTSSDSEINNQASAQASGNEWYAFGTNADRIGTTAEAQITWAVFKAAAITNNFDVLLLAGCSTGREHLMLLSNSGSYRDWTLGFAGSGASGFGFDVSYSGWQTVIQYYDGVNPNASSSWGATFDGVSQSISNSSTISTAGTRVSRIGAWWNGSLFYGGELAEIGGVAGTAISSQILSNFASYFSTRYGL